MSSDCPCCFEPVTDATGKTVTSCGHVFHTVCIITWYFRQVNDHDAKESCPCCRNEEPAIAILPPSEFFDTLGDSSDEEDEGEDEGEDDDTDEDEDGDEPSFMTHYYRDQPGRGPRSWVHFILYSMRTVDAYLRSKDLQGLTEQEIASTEFHSWRAIMARHQLLITTPAFKVFADAFTLNEGEFCVVGDLYEPPLVIERSPEYTAALSPEAHSIQTSSVAAMVHLDASEFDEAFAKWQNAKAVKIQAVWRGRVQRQVFATSRALVKVYEEHCLSHWSNVV